VLRHVRDVQPRGGADAHHQARRTRLGDGAELSLRDAVQPRESFEQEEGRFAARAERPISILKTRLLIVALLLAAAACANELCLRVEQAPEYAPHSGAKVSIFGVFHDGRMEEQ